MIGATAAAGTAAATTTTTAAATTAASIASYMSIAAAAGSLAMGAMQAISAQAEGKAMAEANKRAQKLNNERLLKETIYKYQELDKQEADVIYDAHSKSLQAQKEFMQARSQVEANAAATGTYGKSIDTAVEDLKTGYGGRMADIVYEQQSSLDNINKRASDIAQGYSAGYDTRRIKQPSAFRAITSGIGTAVNMYGTTSGFLSSYQGARQAKSGAKVD